MSPGYCPKLNAVGAGRVIEVVLPLIGLITPGTRAGYRLAAVLAKLGKSGYAHLRNPPAGGDLAQACHAQFSHHVGFAGATLKFVLGEAREAETELIEGPAAQQMRPGQESVLAPELLRGVVGWK